MADMRDFGEMDASDRGGPHAVEYPDGQSASATPGPTPSQTLGPFFAYALTPASYGYGFDDLHTNDLVTTGLAGERIVIEGQVRDANGTAVDDAMVEIVQADSDGRYAARPRNDGFTGYGRCGTGARGGSSGDTQPGFYFRTIKPGSTQSGAAPFISIILTMRGMLNHCITRLYFPNDDHASDPVLQQVPARRRPTLVAEALDSTHFRFDIRIQGERETVFFDV